MPVYLRTASGERVLLDTSKAKLDYEGVEYDLTGGTLEFFEFAWVTAPGAIGVSDPVPGMGLRIEDGFSGLATEVVFPHLDADRVALGLADRPGGERRLKRVARALGL